jgi:hypothetical protein
MGPECWGELGGNLWEEGSVSLWENMLVFQAEIYTILACAYEIHMNARPQNYVSISCDRRL